MGLYRVCYQSMSAFYGPTTIEAESEHEARRKFAGTAFRPNEFSLIQVRPIAFKDALAMERRAHANAESE